MMQLYRCPCSRSPAARPKAHFFWPGPNPAWPGSLRARAGPARWGVSDLGRHSHPPGGTAQPGKKNRPIKGLLSPPHPASLEYKRMKP